MSNSYIINPEDRILITGATGFIGCRVVRDLVARGFRNLVCLARPSANLDRLEASVLSQSTGAQIEILRGNLLSPADCEAATRDAAVIYHLAAGTGTKSFADAVLNSVVTTRNLLDASLRSTNLKRFVLVSSFAVYTNRQKSRRLDESSPVENHPELRADAYCYAKVKQEEIVKRYAQLFGNRYVILRPGSVYGGGKSEITGRVGIGTFGFFLHLGGSNRIPFTYVDNCASAIALAGLVDGVDGEVFNVVDDDLPSSRQFLRSYKQNVKPFSSVYVPRPLSYALCYLWEKYSDYSKGQLPSAFNRDHWYSLWRKTGYSNQHLKRRLDWAPQVSTAEAMQQYFTSCHRDRQHA
jgi:nucleoside-diphosphate-sugar epimerase